MHARNSFSPPALNRTLCFSFRDARSVDAKKESKFFCPQCRTMSLKYRRIVVDESALAPIAGRKLTFDKVCIVMRCKTFACIRGSSRFKISLAYRNRDTPGRFLFSNLSLSLSLSLSVRGDVCRVLSRTRFNVAHRYYDRCDSAASNLIHRGEEDSRRIARVRNVFQGGESASYSHPSFLSFSLYSDEKNIFTKKKISIDIR